MYHLLLGLEMSHLHYRRKYHGSLAKQGERTVRAEREKINIANFGFYKTRTLWRGAEDHLVLVRFERRLVLHSAQGVELPEHDYHFL